MNKFLNFIKTEKVQRLVSCATEYLLYLLICLISFSIRHVFNTSWNFTTGAYSDFTSFSLYLSDIVIFLFIILSLLNREMYKKQINKTQKAWKHIAILLLLWLTLSFIFNNLLLNQLYFSVRMTLLIVLAVILSRITVSREKIAWLFTILGIIQSIISIVQFHSQKSLGLYLIGESHLSASMYGVAKIVSHGTTLIRGYGTFPHPNLLAAFLVVSTLLNLYLIIKSYQNHVKLSHVVMLNVFLSINIYGLFTTFSRGGVIALISSLTLLLLLFALNKRYSAILQWIVPCGTAFLIPILLLGPYLSTRTTISDNSTKERMFYNRIGFEMVTDKPFLGQGAGQSVLHMKQYAKTELEPWEIQPIHNYYLISWSELGAGAIFLYILIFLPILGITKRIFWELGKFSSWKLVLLSIFASFIVLFMVDHYFYTIWPTQMLLWVLIALSLNSVASETEK